jgi:hypothetical protein
MSAAASRVAQAIPRNIVPLGGVLWLGWDVKNVLLGGRR